MLVRASLSVTASLATVAALAQTAVAAPIEFVEQRDTYMLFDDIDRTVEDANWFYREPFFEAYRDIEAGFLEVHPDDSQFLIIYTTWDLQNAGAMFQAVANEVEGIGYANIAETDNVIPEAIFDDTPDSQVFGFMHMSDWKNYLGDDPGGVDDSRISLIFGQELGHAWLSFPHIDQGDGADPVMLGRSNAHWSFYLHSGGSPVEGHDWVDNGDGTYTAVKHDQFQYSDLDLYLMGLMPADEVEPWFVLENPTNCIDSNDGECAPPNAHGFRADSYTVTADKRMVTIDDVIAAEGPRVPAHGDAPDTFDISFVLIKRPEETIDEDLLEQMDEVVNRSIEVWEDQTRGRGHLINRTARDGDPDGDDPGDPGDGDTGDDGDTGTTGTGDSGTGETTTDEPTGTMPPEDTGSDTTTDAGTGGGVTGGGVGEGCSCRSGPAEPMPVSFGLLLLSLLGIGRRRNSRRPR